MSGPSINRNEGERMSEPIEITQALDQLERASKSPRELAREQVEQFRLDREKGERPLPTTNVHDDQGAPVLDVDGVIRRSEPDYVERAGRR